MTSSKTKQAGQETIESILEYGPLGRPVMTETLLKQLLGSSQQEYHDSARLLKLEDLVQLSSNESRLPVFQTCSPKLLWNQTKDQFGFEPPQFRHEVLPDKMHKVTMLTVLPNAGDSKNYYETLRTHKHVGSHPDYDWIEMVAIGIASTKRRAGQLAALDQIQLWKEATGIDLTIPPESINADNSHTLDTTPNGEDHSTLEALHSASQTLLGLLRCSPIRYDFESCRAKSYWTAEAETYWNGKYYFSTAFEPRGSSEEEVPLFRAASKKEAQKHALIALLEQNQDTPLGKAADSYRFLLETAPRLLALRIPQWKKGLAKELESSLDSWEKLISDSSHDNDKTRKRKSRNIDEKSHPPTTDLPTKEQALSTSSTVLWNQEQEKLEHFSKEHPGAFEAIRKSRDSLPIATLRQKLKEALQSSNVVLVQAGTGSGKSTQVPQFILEDALSSQNASSTRILVTQPRRIAAKSLAERVSYERLEGPKNRTFNSKNRSVGYSVRFDSVKPRKEGGTIEYITTGILLKRFLNGDQGLKGISHVLIDEVHERDLNTDLLLVLMRDLLIQRQQEQAANIPKLVLLSATLDASALTDYFAPVVLEEQDSIPALSLPTKPLHPVKTLYLEDILGSKRQNNYTPQLRELGFSLLQSNDSLLKQELDNLQNNLEEKVDNADRIVTQKRAVSLREQHSENIEEIHPLTQNGSRSTMIGLVSELALHLTRIETAKGKNGGSILCFLPGMSEIKECMNRIHDDCPEALQGRLTILPLHSDIPHHEQAKVFKPCKTGTVKVILSTNIAESSLTIDDVLAVIDSGLVKESAFDAASSITKLDTIVASKASSTQRLGRVGRVGPGICYRLYSKGDFEAMPEKTTPGIQKTNLGGACLQVAALLKLTNFERIEDLLGNTMDPPPEDIVQLAVNELTSLGAIDESEEITSLGECLVRFPLDPSVGKMLVMGAAMNCLAPLLTAAAWFGESQIVFSNASLTETRESNRFFSETSDMEGILRAYDAFWQVQSLEGWKVAKQWAREHSVNPAAMVAMKKVRQQLLDELCEAGLVEPGDISKGDLREGASIDQHGDSQLLVSALWCTAVPQNLAAPNRVGGFGKLSTFSEEVARLHPSSVLFHRKPPQNDHNDDSVVIPEWYSFRRKVQTSSVFLRGCSSVLPEQILLFGGSHLDTSNPTGGIHGILDGWITIEGEKETVNLLIHVRKTVEVMLERKLSSNQFCNENDDFIVNSIRMFLDKLETGRIPESEPRAPSNDFIDYFLEDGDAEGE